METMLSKIQYKNETSALYNCLNLATTLPKAFCLQPFAYIQLYGFVPTAFCLYKFLPTAKSLSQAKKISKCSTEGE